jgi:hypothetical protein
MNEWIGRRGLLNGGLESTIEILGELDLGLGSRSR